ARTSPAHVFGGAWERVDVGEKLGPLERARLGLPDAVFLRQFAGQRVQLFLQLTPLREAVLAEADLLGAGLLDGALLLEQLVDALEAAGELSQTRLFGGRADEAGPRPAPPRALQP